jgi:PadR family transcriptional regulator
MEKPDSLGQFEQLVLAAVASLDDAYGVTIREKVEQLSLKSVKFGPIYTTLDRLEDKGYLTSWMSEPLPERGGRAKRCYRLQLAGKAALREAAATSTRILDAIAGIVTEG